MRSEISRRRRVHRSWLHDFRGVSSVLRLAAAGTLLVAVTQLQSVRAVAQAQAKAIKPEIRRTLPLTSFYDTPNPLPAGRPGDLIRAEVFEEYALPPGVSAVRVLYHSRSATGEDVLASGVVLFPEDETPPAGGWPVIAWAHGSRGVARQCAPSLMRDLDSGSFLSMYVEMGYAVVATDYTGLGTRFRNAFSDMQSNATDVSNSIPAARSAVPQLGRKWVALGTSEGGMAVAALAELETEVRDANYLGGIAISGVAETKDLYEHLAQGPSHDVLAFLAYGIKTVYPEFQPGDMLTEKALTLYHQIEEACAIAQTGREIAAGEMLKPHWQDDKYVKQYFARNTLGQKPAYGPLLVISGETDPALPLPATAPVIARMCKQGDRIQFEKYPDPDPRSLAGNSVMSQITWIRARFSGAQAPANCP
jgi:pimeloyl-ACP methyl ester carboxylesterase